MDERIENSRVQATLDAINATIDGLMAQNTQNRVAVCGYGANATVLMPLAHYRHGKDSEGNDIPYLSVGGMETLYHPSDLVYRTQADGVDTDGWYWMNNRDTCYTVVVNGGNEMNSYTGPLSDENDGNKWKEVNEWTVSNNVRSEGVKAFPGVADPKNATDISNLTNQENSKRIYTACSTENGADKYEAGKDDLIQTMKGTSELKADDYVGYFTNTQGGIYLAYKQLADSDATTYSEPLTTGAMSTVARIPAAIIMSDGGANFAFNEMGDYTDVPHETVEKWELRYGRLIDNRDETGWNDEKKYITYENQDRAPFNSEWYIHDNYWMYPSVEKDTSSPLYPFGGREKDFNHRLNDNVGDEWYNVYLPGKDTLKEEEGKKYDGLPSLHNSGADYYQDGTLTTQPIWDQAGILYNSDNDPTGTAGTVMQVLLTASYMNKVVKEHYEHGWAQNRATEESRVPLSTFTMNVDTAHVPQWGRMRLYPTLDPKEYPLDAITTDHWYQKEKQFGTDKELQEGLIKNNNPLGSNGLQLRTIFEKGDTDIVHSLSKSWEEWKNEATTKATMTQSSYDPIAIKINQIGGGSTYKAGGGDVVEITDQEVIDNIAYNDEFYDVEAEELKKIFSQILSIILRKVFVPVSGSNDAGVGDSITYQDPIGLYMEVKNGAIKATPYHRDEGSEISHDEQTYDMAMLLFGEMHGVVRTGVYDYDWIEEYKKTHGGSFSTGWYQGDGASAQKAEKTTVAGGSSYPSECDSVQDAWDKGWVMRLDFSTLAQFVPIVGEESDQTRNTVYTVYRFSCPQDDRNKLRINPVYGEAVPQDILDKWEAAKVNGQYPQDNAIYRDTDGVYRLSDIRIWTESTGDFQDDIGAIAPNTGYTDSLYVNLPAAAVPTQLAEITMGPSGVMSYRTNLGSDHGNEEKYCVQSTPFRLFYTVGVTEALIERDEAGNQTGINVAALPDDYIKKHTENGNLYFYSNYYSETTYNGYGSDESLTYRTMGDPTVSFSASSDNRYYVFQKPLPLYAHAYRVKGGTLVPVDKSGTTNPWTPGENQTGGNGSTTWEDGQTGGGTWTGGRFMGVYESQEDYAKKLSEATKNEDGTHTITDANGGRYKVVEDGVVVLKSDLLDHVTSKEDGTYADGSISFASEDYFFILLEYYLPNEEVGRDIDNKEVPGTFGGEAIQYVVSRKGGAFGSGLPAENIGNGDMLCWTDMKPGLGLALEYFSRTDTGDNTRGEPAYELFTKKGEELEDFLRGRGLRDVPGEGEEESPLDRAVKYWLGVQEELKDVLLLADKAEGIGNKNDYLDKEEYDAYFSWAVAAKPGGLRVGDMFQNMRPKEGDLVGSYYEGNVTHTANNYYVPTLSLNSRIDDIIINNYLGNNGRLYVSNSYLYVAKTIDIPESDPNRDTLLKTRFDYQVYIEGYTGQMDAILLRWNPWGNDGKGTWQRQIDTIDVKTSNEGLLLDGDNTMSVMGYVGGKLVHLKSYNDGSEIKYYPYDQIDSNGQPIEGSMPVEIDGDGGPYYVYVGGEGDKDDSSKYVKRLFQSDLNVTHAGRTVYSNSVDLPPKQTNKNEYWNVYKEANTQNSSGSMDYWFKDAYLIPVEEVMPSNAVQAADMGGESPAAINYNISLIALDLVDNSWKFNPEDISKYKHLGYVDGEYSEDKDPFFIAHLDQVADSSDVIITSEFALETKYKTRTVYFGNKTSETIDEKGAVTGTEMGDVLTVGDLFDTRQISGRTLEQMAANTAQFTLTHEEGLLFPGLDSSSDYRITEKDRADFALEQATHTQERSETAYEPDETNGATGAKVKNGPDGGKAYFLKGVYSLDGDTSSSKEEGAWYVNRYDPGTLSVTKVLKAGEGGEITEEDKERLFDFTLKLTAPEEPKNPEKLTVKGPFTYTITDDKGQTIKEGKLLPKDMKEEARPDLDVVTDGDVEGVWKFQLKGGWTMTVKGVPVQSGYTYEISERIFGGFEVSDSEKGEDKDGEHIVTGEVKAGQDEPVEVTFTNTKKYAPGVFSIEKELRDWGNGKLTEEDLKQSFNFELKLTWPDSPDDPLEDNTITYVITDAEGETVENGHGRLLPHGSETSSEGDAKDIVADENGIWKFQLKGGQTITVEGLPMGTGYSYNVSEEHLDHYTPSYAIGEGEEQTKLPVTGTVTPGQKDPERVKFINTQEKPEPVPVELKLTKNLSDESATGNDLKITEGQFSFIVTPDGNNPEDDPIKKQDGWGTEVAGALVVKNGKPDSDGKTAKATIFDETTMKYQTPGTYVYTVTEQVSSEAGISSDISVYTVTVVVSKLYEEDGDNIGAYKGQLNAEVTVTKGSVPVEDGINGIKFTNKYRENNVEVPLKVKKEYNGNLESGMFTFELTGVEFKAANNALSAGGSERQLKSVAESRQQEKSGETGEPQGDSDEEQGSGGTGGSSQDSGEIVSPGGETKPDAGKDSEEETKPGSETKPGDETQPGTGTGSEGETQPGAGGDSGGETDPGTGTDSGEETKSGTETNPGGGTKPETGTKPEEGTSSGTETRSGEGTPHVTETGPETGTQSGTGQQGQKFTSSVVQMAESLLFRITALRQERRTAVPVAVSGMRQITVPAEGSGGLPVPATSASQEGQQAPATSAPQIDEEQPGDGQKETAGDEEKEETGNDPGGTQTEETEGTPGSDQQSQGGTETSPDETLPPKEQETGGSQKKEPQSPDGSGTSSEDTLPPDEQETQGSGTEGKTGSGAEKEADSGEKNRRSGEISGMLGDEPMPIADVMPKPSEGVEAGADEDGHTIWTQSNAEDGWVDFGTLTFDQAGTYTYELREVKGEKSHIVYSGDVYQIIIEIVPEIVHGDSGVDTTLLKVKSIKYKRKQNGEGAWQEWNGAFPVFTNELKTGGLKVEKSVTGSGGETERRFHFTVEFKFDSTEIPKDVTITKNGNPADHLEIDENGKLEFTLRNGEYVEVEGLPEGTTYTVTEEEANQNGYTTTYTVTEAEASASGYVAVAAKAEAGTNGTAAIPQEGEASADESSATAPETEVSEDEPSATAAESEVSADKPVAIAAESEVSADELTIIPAVPEASADGLAIISEEAEVGADGLDMIMSGPGANADEPAAIPAESEANADEPVTIPAGNEVNVVNLDEIDTILEGDEIGLDESAVITAEGTIEEKKQDQVKFVNDRHVGNLTVTKTVTGTDGDLNKEWNFVVELSDTTIEGQYGDMFFTNGKAEFKLKSGESATAWNLPPGITYKVTETEANQDGYETLPSGETGTIPDGVTAEAKFVNKKGPPPPPEKDHGNLTVTKTVTGSAGDKEKRWHFRVELSDTTIEGQYGDMFFTDGVAEFTLKSGQSATAENLPSGITYTVTETEANQDGYSTSSTGASGTIPEGDTAKAEFVNKKDTPPPPPPPPPPDEHYGNLTVTKTVTGIDGDLNKEWHFRVELSNRSIHGRYGDMYFTDGVAEFTLKSGQSATARNLPPGTGYTVTEAEANQDGYGTYFSNALGTIPNGGTARAGFVNSKGTPPPPDNPPGNPGNPPGTPYWPGSPFWPDSPLDTPQTGDNSHFGLWLSVMIFSLIGVVALSVPVFGKERAEKDGHKSRRRRRRLKRP